jgi:HJR/Mrr/RecB family endonuclease
VNNKAVQEIYGAMPMYSKHFKRKFLPMVITNNSYTASAKDLANSNGVILVDRQALGQIIEASSNSLKSAKKY